jgi:hypothetical protein
MGQFIEETLIFDGKNHGRFSQQNQSIYPLVIQQFAMERSTIYKFGKPSISMGHGSTMDM